MMMTNPWMCYQETENDMFFLSRLVLWLLFPYSTTNSPPPSESNFMLQPGQASNIFP